ncbi:hypothetical protein FOCC_FOCC010919 [Frankliniella occidentalis]|nr:hypothetical protein FOCC_FOCC010919 [Frankliniella occidentalis]
MNEQYPKFQKQFFENCAALKESFLQSENPFLIKTPKLLTLDSRIEIGEKGIASLNSLEKVGVEMLKDFVEKRLQSHEIPFYSPVKLHKIEIFTFKKSSQPSAISELKCDVQLFSRLFIVSLARKLDLKKFFEYENQLCPPSLALNGDLRSGTKSYLVPILEQLSAEKSSPESCDGIVLDGAAVVRLIPRAGATSFLGFSQEILKYCLNFASKMNCNRVDIVWDQYSTFPKQQKQWDSYLNNDGNKT